MAKTHFTTGYMTITNAAAQSFTLTDYLRDVTINYGREELDRSYVGCVGKARGAGLYDWSVDVVCWQDFADNTVDETIQGLVSGGTQTTIAFRPSSAVQSASNPTYAGVGIILNYPLALQHGTDNMISFTILGADGAAMSRTAT